MAGGDIFLGMEAEIRNSTLPTRPMVDDFACDALAPHLPAFVQGADILCGHTVLLRLGLGYTGKWAASHFPGIHRRNAFLAEIGAKARPSKASALPRGNPPRDSRPAGRIVVRESRVRRGLHVRPGAPVLQVDDLERLHALKTSGCGAEPHIEEMNIFTTDARGIGVSGCPSN